MLIDPGSELTLISSQLAQLLQVRRQRSSIPIQGVGAAHSGRTRGLAMVTLKSIHSNATLDISAHILGQLTTELPSFATRTQGWPHLTGLQLADPDFGTPRPIDILIGADSFASLIESSVIKGAPNEPIAQRTRFGWIVLGPTSATGQSPSRQVNHIAVNTDHCELQELLTRFWTQEEVPQATSSQLTPEELECEQHFIKTHTRDKTGRYTVRLPIKSSSPTLGKSKSLAERSLSRLNKRLARDSKYEELYSSFIREYEQLDHMRLVQSPKEPTRSYYLPHHGVYRADNSTTKLRVVFNGSSQSTSGYSLNDTLHTGAKLQLDIFDVLLWVRKQRFIFLTDITKMFRQINVHSDDWDLQRILWTDSSRHTLTYQLTTVTYGTRSAPFLAGRVLNQLTADEGHRFPLAIEPLSKGCYVDDICGGADTLDKLVEVAKHVQELCMAGGFPLAKWQSNHQRLLNKLSLQSPSTENHSFEEDSKKVLGLLWHSTTDQFKFVAKSHSSRPITKRTILSEVAQLYDPLGFLSPLIIRAKILLQELWLEKLGWDDLVATHANHRWVKFREELTQLNEIRIPRWLKLDPQSPVEIHGYSDASQLAMAAVVYLRVSPPDTPPLVTLVCAKTKVAPLKKLTIPRLELSAATLLARLVNHVQITLELQNSPTYLWTDSSVTLTWVRSHPSRWRDYVQNRVSSIQSAVPHAKWNFIPGKENPADCASRGLTASQLSRHSLWWDGPLWLKQSSDHWPQLIPKLESTADLEERPGLTLATVKAPVSPTLWERFSRCSTLNSLLRLTSIAFRVRARLKGTPQSSLATPLTPGDLEQSRLYWIRAFQSIEFASELKLLEHHTHLPKGHALNRLTAFIDRQGILRVGGRLQNSALDPEHKHPIILSRASPLSQLIIADAHQRTLHGGTQITLADIRRNYWILGGRAPVRSYILRCITCARQRGERAQQLMGQLPQTRTTPSRPFLNTGVDYAGPVSLKSWKGRGAKIHKGWLAIFVCFSTSALHLELVTDYSQHGFIAAYRRFISRRGICRNLYSDCGTNFLGADATLKQLFKSGTKESLELARLLTNDGTKWSFNPPSAPHFGGKWEAAVKSVKHHLRRTIQDTLLTYEEFSTLLTQIEAVLNSRPLCALSDDPQDLTALTPGHFLIGESTRTIPEPSINCTTLTFNNRWQLIQQKLQHFWARWSAECLQQFLAISKWHHSSNQIKVGSLVLISDERFPPSKWPLARVIITHPGKDGLTRVVTLKTATTTLIRPIAKLVVLPLDSSTSSILDTSNPAASQSVIGSVQQKGENSRSPQNLCAAHVCLEV